MECCGRLGLTRRDNSVKFARRQSWLGARMERDLDSTGMNLRRLAHEVAETRRRMVIGGSFYVLGWVLVCLFTPVVRTYPWASAALALGPTTHASSGLLAHSPQIQPVFAPPAGASRSGESAALARSSYWVNV